MSETKPIYNSEVLLPYIVTNNNKEKGKSQFNLIDIYWVS